VQVQLATIRGFLFEYKQSLSSAGGIDREGCMIVERSLGQG
jgi:hypothetical protein